MPSWTAAKPVPNWPVEQETQASGVTKPAGASPAPEARKISANGNAFVSAAPANAGAKPAIAYRAFPGSGGVRGPAVNIIPGLRPPQLQQPKGNAMMMDSGYGNSMYRPSNMRGYASMCDFGGMSSTQPPGFMYGNRNGMASGSGSMGGGQDGMGGYGSMAGGVSIYGGMGCKSMVSLYGMGGSMNWMYGMGGNPIGSLYGMDGPVGFMYGMGCPTGSMYGMGGMGYMMARSMSFSSYGGQSIYGSIGGNSLMKIGDSAYSIGGMWSTEPGSQVRRHPDCDMPTVAKALQDDDETRRCLVPTTATMQRGADNQLPMKGAATAATNGAKAAEEYEKVASGDKSKLEGDDHVDERVKQETKSRARSSPPAVLNSEVSAAKANEDKDGVTFRNGIRGIVIVENAKSTTVMVERAETGYKVSLKLASGEPAECKVSEVMEGADADMSKSAVLNTVSTHLLSGHNVALIAVDREEKMSAAVENAIVTFYAGSLGKLVGDHEWRATFSAAAISGATNYRDLQDDKATAALPKAIALGSNPICGACIMDLKKVMMKDVETVAVHVKGVLAKKTHPRETVLMQAILRIRMEKDLFICSMNAYVVRDSETAEALAILDDRRVPVPVLRPAIGGSTCTTAVMFLSGAAPAAAEAEAMRIMGTLCAKESSPPRSGNVQCFIEYADEQIKKIGEMENLSSAEKDRCARMVKRMRTMASDARELIGNMEMEPSVYPIHSKSSAPSVAALAAADKESNAKEAAALTEAAKTGDIAANRKPKQAAVPDGKAPTAEKHALHSKADAATPAAPASPFNSIHRLAYLQDAIAPSIGKVVQVIVDGGMKAYDVDECIERPAGANVHAVGESNELRRMAALVAAGFNVALLGAEFTEPTRPGAQMTWQYVRLLLTLVLKSAEPETATEATLHMSVVHEREVLADLGSGDTARHSLVVAMSPLFGPVVQGSTGVKASTPEELEEVMSKTLANAKPALKDGAMIVMTAVVRQNRHDDVMVGSVFAVSSADLRPYKSILEHNPSYCRTLFSYALGGPSSTGVLITASRKMNAPELANAFSMQRNVAHVGVPASRRGSVREFIQYARGSLERQKKKVAAETEPAEKEAAEKSLCRLAESLRDHEELLANPKTAEVKAYPPESVAGVALSPTARECPGRAATPPELQQFLERGAELQREEAQKGTARVTPDADRAPQPQEAKSEKLQSLQAHQTEEPKLQKEELRKPQPAEEQQTPQQGNAFKEEPQEAVQDDNTQAVQILAVITEDICSGLQVKEGWSVESSGEQLIVTDVQGPHSFLVDEVVVRQNRGSPIDSTVLEELRHRFLQGNNVALLTTEARGSMASLEMVDRTVRRILGKMPPSNSLFMSLCALKEKENAVLDTLTDGGEFQTVELNASPLFGPSMAGANFVKVSMVEQFSKLMGGGLRKCGQSRACVVLQLVQVEIREEQQDVNVSSLLALMCPGDTSIYRHALDQPVREHGLLSLVFSGSCYTVFAVGLTRQPIDEGCLILPRLGQAFKGSVRNFKPRGGSVKRFIEHTNRVVAYMQQNCERTTSDEEKAKMQGYIDAVKFILEQSEAYLADPVNKMPPSFPDVRERRKR
ncbi:conserved hypothetical protein [Leishmania mexicana MHOM/GT/2001/U1103]|uniref:Present in the outer mitochondrial membrane proteome 22 n=1 Tax=Leishmania mexicana (strain MHOM/GT/2001/U1103) TaxID=929439 RepID=E9B4D2_LEIMU|nr:conserved hypothetical protein [Leishmania mexicana MHOM/GT/2001/U1103]CBZ30100.1 conserved hypothetical protein [Leishmania mexicana MHOM/GT/2001/U1103]